MAKAFEGIVRKVRNLLPGYGALEESYSSRYYTCNMFGRLVRMYRVIGVREAKTLYRVVK